MKTPRLCAYCRQLDTQKNLERYGALDEEEPEDYVIWLHEHCFEAYTLQWARNEIAIEDAVEKFKGSTKP